MLIKLRTSALCRSDLHNYHGESVFEDDSNKSAMITPGHEPCGVVEQVGTNVKCVQPGDGVAIYLASGCGKCAYCLQGYPMLCKEFHCLGFDSGSASQTNEFHGCALFSGIKPFSDIPNPLNCIKIIVIRQIRPSILIQCKVLDFKGFRCFWGSEHTRVYSEPQKTDSEDAPHRPGWSCHQKLDTKLS